MKKSIFILLTALLLFVLAAFKPFSEQEGTAVIQETDVIAESVQPEKSLSISLAAYGQVRLSGDIHTGDRVRLYSREYRSSEGFMTDRLLSEKSAAADGSMTISYNWYTPPLEEKQITPDFDYGGTDVVLKALYGTVSDGSAEIHSKLLYIEGFLETSVISQYWCSFAPSTACGSAAGVLAMQPVYTAYGDELFTRVNTIRNYCASGSEEFSTGSPRYEFAGEHITNGINKYITEELSGSMLLTDHRQAGKSTEKTLIELLITGRPAVIEVCYLRGAVTQEFWGISHFVTINGFFLVDNGYWFRYSDPVTYSYVGISSELLEESNKNVKYVDLPYVPDRYIGALSDPLFSIE